MTKLVKEGADLFIGQELIGFPEQVKSHVGNALLVSEGGRTPLAKSRDRNGSDCILPLKEVHDYLTLALDLDLEEHDGILFIKMLQVKFTHRLVGNFTRNLVQNNRSDNILNLDCLLEQ